MGNGRASGNGGTAARAGRGPRSRKGLATWRVSGARRARALPRPRRRRLCREYEDSRQAGSIRGGASAVNSQSPVAASVQRTRAPGRGAGAPSASRSREETEKVAPRVILTRDRLLLPRALLLLVWRGPRLVGNHSSGVGQRPQREAAVSPLPCLARDPLRLLGPRVRGRGHAAVPPIVWRRQPVCARDAARDVALARRWVRHDAHGGGNGPHRLLLPPRGPRRRRARHRTGTTGTPTCESSDTALWNAETWYRGAPSRQAPALRGQRGRAGGSSSPVSRVRRVRRGRDASSASPPLPERLVLKSRVTDAENFGWQ